MTRQHKDEDGLEQSDIRAAQIVLDSLDAMVYVSDLRTYEILFVNKYGRSVWGDIRGETCWEVLQAGQDGPCSFCTNHHLLDESGRPAEAYVWDFQNTIDKRWYQCRDQAVRWTDGRFVRLEFATDITERKDLEDKLRAARLTAEERAHRDVLTGLHNRRAFFGRSNYIYEQSKRFGHSTAIIMMDLDHFKNVNDTYGHGVGDTVLQSVAELLQRQLREVDIVARMGGEEFAFALPETDPDNAAAFAERIRIGIEDLVTSKNGYEIRLTASFGVATCAGGAANIETLLTRADKALYSAKRNGRNQVAVAT